ncbi:RNA polymerase sigma factor [Streptomyces sp. AN-3]|uniref:RNA polymerase sigma factor n=1 Tax=Streptomyces sp. AN-3 TaxID=3044177 RepID=UPI00249AFE75|nr:RNA polymerase sigma factor [Streptomyces sp. AN-3]MDI3102005.1 RNA polymerase sigma factor [Streptomyces sp. AN-3]MDV6291233.1 RNA polymerase sigma factor [Streptomyces sp. UP1A-1]
MTATAATNDQLIARAAAGGADAPTAMSELYARLHSTVHNWVRQYVRDPHISEDLAQEVWIKVAQNVTRYRPGTNFMGWLMTITRNTAVDHLRKEQRRPTEELQPDHLQLDRPRPGLSVPQQVERRQLAEAIAARMNELKPDQRTCLRLRFFDGCTPAHTAQIMGKSEGAVRTLTVRSLRRLAQVLPEGDSSADLVEELLTIAAGRGNVVGVRVQTTQERAPHHVATR